MSLSAGVEVKRKAKQAQSVLHVKNPHERGERDGGLVIEQRWQGWVTKSRLGMDPRCGDWLSRTQMGDGAHRKRINCLISAR